MADGTPERPYSLSGEVAQITMAAESRSAAIKREITMLLRGTRAYRKLFFDEQGALKPEGRVVLQDIAAQADLHRASIDLDPQALAELEGRRRLAMHVFGRFRLPEARLRHLEMTLTEMENDE